MPRILARPAHVAGRAALAVLASATAVGARRVAIPSIEDTTVFAPFQDQISNGSGPRAFCGTTLSFGYRRALFVFDVTDSIPPRAHVDSVQLVLHCDRSNSTSHLVRVYRLTQNWGEAGSSSSGGGGDIARANDATWEYRFYDVSHWTTPGGDFVATASAETAVDQAGEYRWGSTPQLVADVQGWRDDPRGNSGWILIGDESENSIKRFHTRESEMADQRPVLIVDYSPPTSVVATSWSAVKSLYMSPSLPVPGREARP